MSIKWSLQLKRFKYGSIKEGFYKLYLLIMNQFKAGYRCLNIALTITLLIRYSLQ